MRTQLLSKVAAASLGGLLAGLTTTASALAAAPNLPNPCALVTVAEINAALNKSGAHPAVSHTSYQPESAYASKSCTWKYGSTIVTVSVYDKSGGSGGGPTKTTPEPSLGPNGQLSQSQSATYPSTSVSYTRHSHHVGIYVNRNVSADRMVALGKHAYNRT